MKVNWTTKCTKTNQICTAPINFLKNLLHGALCSWVPGKKQELRFLITKPGPRQPKWHCVAIKPNQYQHPTQSSPQPSDVHMWQKKQEGTSDNLSGLPVIWTPIQTKLWGTEADLRTAAQFITSADLDTQTKLVNRGWPYGYSPIRHIHRSGHPPRLKCGGQRLTLGLQPNSSHPQTVRTEADLEAAAQFIIHDLRIWYCWRRITSMDNSFQIMWSGHVVVWIPGHFCSSTIELLSARQQCKMHNGMLLKNRICQIL
jgi:hypothetical protein